jgi:hypothetical protein
MIPPDTATATTIAHSESMTYPPISELTRVSEIESEVAQSPCILRLVPVTHARQIQIWVLGYLPQSQTERSAFLANPGQPIHPNILFGLALSILRLCVLAIVEQAKIYLGTLWSASAGRIARRLPLFGRF